MSAFRSITRLAAPRALTARPFHSSSAISFPYKDDMDRNSLKPRSTENTKSGQDACGAANPDAAFNPDKTSPEEAIETAGQGNEGNPLNASGANQEISKPRGDEKTRHDNRAGKETSKGGASKGGSSPKNSDPKNL